jgi:hypothetical protein
MPTAALAFDVLFGLTALTWQAANGLWWLLLFVGELDVVHLHQQFAVLVFSNLHPLNK